MINAIGFLVAVAAVSTVIFVLMTRAENVRMNRARSRGSSSYDGGNPSDSWSIASWVGYSSSVDSSNATDTGACTTGSWDSGGSDSGGGGGDCGGGGGGGSSD
jgi:hypothetical protein